MANYQSLELPSSLLFDQIEEYIGYMFEQSTDKSMVQYPLDFITLAASSFNRFLNNMGLPISEPLVFSIFPIADDWNKYQKNIVSDLKILYKQYINIADNAHTMAHIDDVETQMLLSATHNLASQISGFQITNTTQEIITWNIVDNFLDTSKIDVAETSALVTTANVELHRKGYHSHNNIAKLRIDDEFIKDVHLQNKTTGEIYESIPQGISNGFLGNTHEVEIQENTNTNIFKKKNVPLDLNANPSNRAVFVGDTNLHSDIGVVLDGNAKTWFEYEVCNIPNPKKLDPCMDYGFNFTLGRADGGTIEIPWYKFHEKGALEALEKQSFFPPPAGTDGSSPYVETFDPQSGQYIVGGTGYADPYNGTVSTSASGATLRLHERGAPRYGGLLRLAINATFDSAPKMSHINIMPKVIAGKPCVVRTVEVRSGHHEKWVQATELVNPIRINSLDNFNPDSTKDLITDEISAWVFPEQNVKYARIVFEQPQSYDTFIGHIAWTSSPLYQYDKAGAPTLVNVGSLISSDVIPDTDIIHRVNGPEISLEKLISVSFDSKGRKQAHGTLGGSPNPGIKLHPGIQSTSTADPNTATNQSSTTGQHRHKHHHDKHSAASKNKSLHKIGSVLSLIPNIKNYLAGSKYNANSYKYPNSISGPYIEYFDGWRYAIAINAIEFGTPIYTTHSLLMAKDQKLPLDIKQVQLFVNEIYPDDKSFKKNIEWIKYSFSLDGGHRWHDIAPKSHFYSKHKQIFNINPIHGEDSVDENEATIHTAHYDPITNPVTKIRLRAELHRPHNRDGMSPHLLNYQLQIQGLRIP